MSIPQRYIKNYFKRFASSEQILDIAPDPSCKMIIVIPCHDEPDLIGTLESLVKCQPVGYTVEVIVVVNHGESAMSDVRSTNEKTISTFQNWVENSISNIQHLTFHLVEGLDMPEKTAGVGLARKIGLDEALRRFMSIDIDGAIVCLDADCRVSKNYLVAIEQQFVQSKGGVGEMYFEHPYQSEADSNLREGIINYELFLRYYVEGLRQARFPNAIHTIGSCMLIKASIYAKHGGMNKRKAGEDFYFLHKIVPHEQFVHVNQATVFPSCRTSDRVPFGTGKAQNDWLETGQSSYPTYDPRVFQDLKKLNTSIDALYEKPYDQWLIQLPSLIQEFFNRHHYAEKVIAIKRNAKSLEQFEKQFYIWFDGFLCLKFVHFARDHFYPNVPLGQAASALMKSTLDDKIDLLNLYRKSDLQH